jgi:hypothetical protein
MPASLMGSQVFQIKFDYQTALELFHQEDNGSIRVHLDLVIFSPFVLRSSDGTICNLDPQTSRTALAPVIDLFGGRSQASPSMATTRSNVTVTATRSTHSAHSPSTSPTAPSSPYPQPPHPTTTPGT